ncbi:hypothetical protein E1B28_000002 [Marasmius oreades]|uniref:Uncharacterized protein n=1 Tax=Marasmius oreades TaxID=181124 RepID=A0A9P7V0I8_9AGAR|nr:uncharacterized protein E1B28_000002 [Marasmius oreades]KAG7098026.1 hypothetical protein E1B28_000002 [Marasmius oreades]
MTGLYSERETKSYTLCQFNDEAQRLLQMEDYPEFQKFVLTGESKYTSTQALVDIQPNILPPDHSLDVKRDFDSLIGITPKIAIANSLSIYAVPNPSEVLTTSIHLAHTMFVDGTSKQVPYHHIHNFLLGYWGNRCQLHIFFPTLYAPNPSPTTPRNVRLDVKQMAQFYERGVRPSIANILPESVSDWPPTYDAEAFRIRRSTGRSSYGTKMIPEEFLESFVSELRLSLARNGVNWAKDFFFIHTVRGVKLSSFHTPTPEMANRAFLGLLQNVSIPLENTIEGQWFVDVGLEFRSPDGHTVQWTARSHSTVVASFLQVSDDAANRMTRLGSSRYERDIVSHLTGIAGCRIEPRASGGPYDVQYLQLYSTDKNVTYSPEGRHHGKAIPMAKALEDQQPCKFLEDLYDSYAASVTIAAHARIEVRVSLDYVTQVLMDIPVTAIRGSLAVFDTETWWDFRRYRLLAMIHILGAQATGPSVFRVGRDALLLTAAMVWMINGLHSRPDDGHHSRDLMRAIFPLTDTRDDVDELALIFLQRELGGRLAYFPHGLMFLRRIKTDTHTPHLRTSGLWISTSAFSFFFKMTEEEIRYNYHEKLRNGSSVTRVSNKMHSTRVRISTRNDGDTPMFNLTAQGHSRLPPPVDEGSDIEMDVNNSPVRSIDVCLEEIFLQCMVDIFEKAPNPVSANDASYLVISEDARLMAGENDFKNLRLSDYWTCVFYKVATPTEYTRAFDHLFPNTRRSPKSNNSQNYLQSTYYKRWESLCREVSDEVIEAMKAELRKRYDELLWVPKTVSGRIWESYDTKPGRREAYTRLPLGSHGPAPRILVRSVPQWVSIPPGHPP